MGTQAESPYSWDKSCAWSRPMYRKVKCSLCRWILNPLCKTVTLWMAPFFFPYWREFLQVSKKAQTPTTTPLRLFQWRVGVLANNASPLLNNTQGSWAVMPMHSVNRYKVSPPPLVQLNSLSCTRGTYPVSLTVPHIFSYQGKNKLGWPSVFLKTTFCCGEEKSNLSHKYWNSTLPHSAMQQKHNLSSFQATTWVPLTLCFYFAHYLVVHGWTWIQKMFLVSGTSQATL